MPGAKLSSDPAVPYSTTKPARLQIESRAGTPHQSRCARQSDPTPQPAGGPCEPATHEILCRPPGQALSLRAPRDAVRATTWIVGSVRGKAGCTFSPFRSKHILFAIFHPSSRPPFRSDRTELSSKLFILIILLDRTLLSTTTTATNQKLTKKLLMENIIFFNQSRELR